jgi:signal transduction histidine kinase
LGETDSGTTVHEEFTEAGQHTVILPKEAVGGPGALLPWLILAAGLVLAVLTETLGVNATRRAKAQAELAASRRRIVTASDDARRRIERDLHDGVQQQLVSLSLELQALEDDPPAGEALKAQLASVTEEVRSALDALVEIARGIHPAILAQGGLDAALKGLARRSTVPVKLDTRLDAPVPDDVEAAAYYVASEALTNVVKHAHASVVHIDMTGDDESLTLVVRDDGIGDAVLGGGSGLVGLQDRVQALGGRITIDSPKGGGTRLVVALPMAPRSNPVEDDVFGPPTAVAAPTGPA